MISFYLGKIIRGVRFRLYNLRASYYQMFFNIGRGCHFQKISFHMPAGDIMGKEIVTIGNNVTIWRRTELIAFKDLPISIGDNTFINHGCTISPNVSIGANVNIAPGVLLITDSHEIGSSERRAGKVSFLPIEIGDGCWIGAKVTVLGGVSIGNGTVIAASAVVTENCQPNCLYGGVPARLIKTLN